MAEVNPFRFSTKCQDQDTGLLYYGHRYFTASTGRWLSRDPIEEEGGLTTYGFVNNNGISTVDFFGLAFNVVRLTAPPGTIDPTKPGQHGKTWASKSELIKFSATTETITCAYCVTLHVDKDYDLEITSITPSSIPSGYTENGFNFIVGHEDRRVQVYRRAYNAYLAPLKAIIDGKYLCCSEPFSPYYMTTWALNLVKAYEDAFHNYINSENALISTEYDAANLIYVNSLIDGSRYVYTPEDLRVFAGIPSEPGCYSAREF